LLFFDERFDMANAPISFGDIGPIDIVRTPLHYVTSRTDIQMSVSKYA